MSKTPLAIVLTALLTGCGGGSSSNNSIQANSTPVANSGGQAETTTKQCSLEDKKDNFWRYLNDYYLWADNFAELDLSQYQSTTALFDAVREPVDKFSSVVPTQHIPLLTGATEEIGYGIHFETSSEPAGLVIRYVQAGTPSAELGLKRGDIITRLGNSSGQTLVNQLGQYRYLLEQTTGRSLAIEWLDSEQQSHTDTLVSRRYNASYLVSEQLWQQQDKTIAYLSYQAFLGTGIEELAPAIDRLAAGQPDELILDLRHNGGGAVMFAQYLASMLGGNKVAGQVYGTVSALEKTDRKAMTAYTDLDKNDQMYQELVAASEYLNLDIGQEELFPAVSSQLSLDRVFVLTSEETCSASELLINSLSPYLDLVQIGDTTCGKPYGYIPVNYCGESYLVANMKFVNAASQTDYFDGLKARCQVSEQTILPWGSQQDSLISEALYYLENNQCSQ